MATPKELVFSDAAKPATTAMDLKKISERRNQFDDLVKEIESASNFTDKYVKLSDEDFQKSSATINDALLKQGRGAAIMIKRSASHEDDGQVSYQFRLYTKLYAPGEDYGVMGIQQFTLKLSRPKSENDNIVEILEHDSFSDEISVSSKKLYMTAGEVRLAYPDSAAGSDPTYKKMVP